MSDYWHDSSGALVVSEDAMRRFADEWADEFRWLSEH